VDKCVVVVQRGCTVLAAVTSADLWGHMRDEHARSGGRLPSVTVRQRHVLTLIARGGTNKEIAHELGITERGVAAHVTRLLLRFHSPNRAGLVASVLSEGYSRQAMSVPIAAARPSIESLDLRAFDESHFFVTLTRGRDHVVAYQNKAARLLMSGVASKSVIGRPGGERFTDGSSLRMQEIADDAFDRATTVSGDNTLVRWQNDDGSWDSGQFSWVMQPLFGSSGQVEGILWIGMAAPR
jgi:DNA-binding CsgD family transcriptional regulator